MSLDTGTYGAKVQSWRASNPRDLLKRIIAGNAGRSKADLLPIVQDALKNPDNEDYLDGVIEYWFSNNYHSLIEQAPQVRETKAATKRAAVDTVKTKIVERIKNEARIMLLDMVMPNGKALRDCTGKECAKLGGSLTKIAGKVKPNERVGDALDEAAVKKLWGSK